jgi:hypothetical protein
VIATFLLDWDDGEGGGGGGGGATGDQSGCCCCCWFDFFPSAAAVVVAAAVAAAALFPAAVGDKNATLKVLGGAQYPFCPKAAVDDVSSELLLLLLDGLNGVDNDDDDRC